MFLHDDLRELLDTFNAHEVKYLIVGGYAVGFHAEPRATNDFDLFVKADPKNAHATYGALAAFGAPLRDLGPADFEQEGYWYSFGNPPLKLDILMSIPGVDFDDAWGGRVEISLGNTKAFVISREDLIVAKRAAGRLQDLADVEALEKAGAGSD